MAEPVIISYARGLLKEFPGARSFGRRSASHGGEQLRVADRAIEIDKQAADGRSYQRRPEGTGECLGHDQRPGIVAAVGIQQRPLFPKQPPIGRGYPVTAVITGDDEGIHRADHVTSATRASGETPAAHLRPIRR